MPHPKPRRTEAAAIRLALVLALGGAGLAAAAEEPLKLTIKWSTSSEVDNYGFWVMRSDSEKGPFKEANAKMIPGAGNSDLPRKYSFEDHDVQMGKTYYYFLEDVSTQGRRGAFSPVIAKQCCDRGGAKAPESREVKPDEPAATPPASPTPAPEPSAAP